MTDHALIKSDLTSVLSDEEKQAIDRELAHVPFRKGAAIDALLIVQKHRRWVSDEVLAAVANYLEMSVDELEGIATFYNLIYRKPVGEKVILFCDSVSCWINGCDGIKNKLSRALGVDYGETTEDKRYTLLPVPCLGACDRGPVMLVGDELVTHVDEEKISQLISGLDGGAD